MREICQSGSMSGNRKQNQAKPDCGDAAKAQSTIHRETTVTAPVLDSTRSLRVRRERRWFTAGESPARELFAPPGSNRSGGEGNEAVGASGVEGRVGDLASMQAVT